MIFFTPTIVKYKKKNLDITKLRHSKQISPVPWPFVIVRFHCIRYMSTHTCWQPSWNERVRFILTVSLRIWWQWHVPSSHGRMKNINSASSCSVAVFLHHWRRIFYSDTKWNYRGVILMQKKVTSCISSSKAAGNNKSKFKNRCAY